MIRRQLVEREARDLLVEHYRVADLREDPRAGRRLLHGPPDRGAGFGPGRLGGFEANFEALRVWAEVRVSIVEPRRHRALLQIDGARLLTGEHRHFTALAHRHDPLAGDRDGGSHSSRRIGGEYLAVGQYQIGGRGRGTCGQRQQGDQQQAHTHPALLRRETSSGDRTVPCLHFSGHGSAHAAIRFSASSQRTTLGKSPSGISDSRQYVAIEAI